MIFGHATYRRCDRTPLFADLQILAFKQNIFPSCFSFYSNEQRLKVTKDGAIHEIPTRDKSFYPLM